MAEKSGNGTEFTEEELAGLSEDERAALVDDATDADSLRAVAEGEDDAGDDDAADEGKDKDSDADTDKDGEDDGADADADDDSADADEEDDAGEDKGKDGVDADLDADKDKGGEDDKNTAVVADADADDDDGLAIAPMRYKAEPVEKFQEQIDALKNELAEATDKFRSGDMDLEAFQAKQNDIIARREELNAKKLKHDIAVDFTAQSEQHTAQQQWDMRCQTFIREVRKSEGIDYVKGVVKHGDKEIKLFDEFNKVVKVLANDPDNKQKPAGWFLREGHEMVKARFKLTGKAKPGADDDAAGDDKGKKKPAAENKQKPERRKPDLKAVPKTLGGLPAAGDSDAAADDSEFANLDKLEGLEFEAALARMTPEQQNRYARG